MFEFLTLSSASYNEASGTERASGTCPVLAVCTACAPRPRCGEIQWQFRPQKLCQYLQAIVSPLIANLVGPLAGPKKSSHEQAFIGPVVARNL